MASAFDAKVVAGPYPSKNGFFDDSRANAADSTRFEGASGLGLEGDAEFLTMRCETF